MRRIFYFLNNFISESGNWKVLSIMSNLDNPLDFLLCCKVQIQVKHSSKFQKFRFFQFLSWFSLPVRSLKKVRLSCYHKPVSLNLDVMIREKREIDLISIFKLHWNSQFAFEFCFFSFLLLRFFNRFLFEFETNVFVQEFPKFSILCRVLHNEVRLFEEYCI